MTSICIHCSAYGYKYLINTHSTGMEGFCFNKLLSLQVQGILRRHWNQYRIQFGSGLGAHSDALRSASYTASSITEVQGCYSIDGNSEHMNGKGFHDLETSILKADNLYS